MTPQKMLAIQARLLELQTALQEEFGCPVGLGFVGQAGPDPFPTYTFGPGPTPERPPLTAHFTFKEEEGGRASDAPPLMAGFHQGRP